MPLAAGSRLGHYDIVSSLGAGGMGEVYRARDRKLGREVALKVLPSAISDDPDRQARLVREARALAALNHPHIGAIYGVEEVDGVHGLVLELVEGETLADRIARTGSVQPIGTALTIARHIAEALEAAHDKGIVHRDLKPSNIMITPSGAAKVLDFGLAKAVTREDVGASQTPTMTLEGTREGVILGTAAYMSPEQARGHAVDEQTDIWAFGCVLYEMLTGRRAFAGATVSDTIAAILEREPDWTALPEATLSSARRLIQRCLAKDPNHRVHHIADVRIELEEGIDLSSGARTETAPSVRTLRTALGVCAVVAVAAGALALWSVTRDPVIAPEDLVRFGIVLQPDEQIPLDSGLPRPLAISPDGQSVVYVTRRSSGNRLYVRRLEDTEPTPLAGTDGGIGPFVSPDGGWVGFAAGGFIRKIPITGGTPQTVAPVSNFMGGCWGVNDSIVFAEWNSGLLLVPAGGGTPRPLTTLDSEQGELGHVFPYVLPSGNDALFTVRRRGASAVESVNLATGQRKFLLEGSDPHYVSSGHLVFARGPALYAVPFDLARGEPVGDIVQMPDRVQMDAQYRGDFALAPSGNLVYVPAVANAYRLAWLDREGKARPLVDERRSFNHPRLSPDGTRAVVQLLSESGTLELWVYDVERGTRVRLSWSGSRPIWTPDGKRITVQMDSHLYSLAADDSRGPELLLPREPPGFVFPLAWFSDGPTLVYSRPMPDTNRDVYTLRAGERPTPFLTTPRDERSAMLSPDGAWMVYASLEPGREEEVYVQRYPGPSERIVVSQGGGREPVWSPAGGEIFYRSIDGQRMISVPVRTDPTLSLGAPRTLFQGRFREGFFWSNYDVTRDGQQFLMLEVTESPPPRFNVTLNWLEALKQQQ